MSNNMWADGEKVAFMIAYDRFRDADSNIIEESNSYFCDDKKHDWSATVEYVKRHIAFRKEYFQEHYGRTLEHFMFWSDNGECCCGAFIAEIAKLAAHFNVVITWNFTVAGHSKGKHDGEGHVVKSECRSAISADLILFHRGKEPYSITLRNYMQSFFGDESKKFKFTRHFTSIPASDITHYAAKSVLKKTLKGIMGIHCFIMANAQRIMYRKHSCCCARCIDGIGYSACTRSSICGEWKAWRPVPVESAAAPDMSTRNEVVSPRENSSRSPLRRVGGLRRLGLVRGGCGGGDVAVEHGRDRYGRPGNERLDNSNRQQRSDPNLVHRTAADNRHDPMRGFNIPR